MSRRAVFATLLIAFPPMLGCGGASPKMAMTPDMASESNVVFTKNQVQATKPAAPAGAAAPGAPPAVAVPADVIERKIIYSGQLTVVVKDLDAAVGEVEKLLDENKGYIAKSAILGNAGSRRTATFTIRVPAENFRKLKTALIGIGVAEVNTSDSKDVTEEFVDVTARVKNLKAEEETLNKLLKETAHRLEDILRLREEIKRLRGEIEVAEGRLKYLSALASLSTLDLTLREIQGDYKPPEPTSPIVPSFSERVSSTFHESVDHLQKLGENVAVFGVGLAPWLPILIPVSLVGYVGMRRLTRPRPSAVARTIPRSASPVRPPVDPPGENASS